MSKFQAPTEVLNSSWFVKYSLALAVEFIAHENFGAVLLLLGAGKLYVGHLLLHLCFYSMYNRTNTTSHHVNTYMGRLLLKMQWQSYRESTKQMKIRKSRNSFSMYQYVHNTFTKDHHMLHKARSNTCRQRQLSHIWADRNDVNTCGINVLHLLVWKPVRHEHLRIGKRSSRSTIH